MKRRQIKRGFDHNFPDLYGEYEPEIIENFNYAGRGGTFVRKSKGFSSIRKAS
jgi:hypothetical protein